MNKAMENEMSKLVKEISSTYINALVTPNDSLIVYDATTKKIKAVDTKIKESLTDKIYEFLQMSY